MVDPGEHILHEKPGVSEERRRVEAIEQQASDPPALWMAFVVVIALEPVDPDEFGGVRLPRLAHEVQQRQGDRYDHPDDRAENGHGQEGGHAEQELAAPDRGEPHERADGEDAERGSDHDRGEHRLGQVAEHLRCTNDDSEEQRRCGDTG